MVTDPIYLAAFFLAALAVGLLVGRAFEKPRYPQTQEERAANDFAAGRIDLDALEERLDEILGIQRHPVPCSIPGCSGPATCAGRCWRARQPLTSAGRWDEDVTVQRAAPVVVYPAKPSTPTEREQ